MGGGKGLGPTVGDPDSITEVAAPTEGMPETFRVRLESSIGGLSLRINRDLEFEISIDSGQLSPIYGLDSTFMVAGILCGCM
ncbi:hypothetical protein CRG98_008117 [Punica granatum]|uniref:Uncharacterized protein n=1 Tax=Punica granatum TaxID=22663 RepID=A0A2I0KSG6_PUNGR|nr:hypothetical protein CRG98_008117 [Punica granatum]